MKTNGAVLMTSEPRSEAERRKSNGLLVERVFAQHIYRALIRALVGEKGKNQRFKLSKQKIKWLARTFVREGIGAQEEAYVCLYPAYDEETDKQHLVHKSTLGICQCGQP